MAIQHLSLLKQSGILSALTQEHLMELLPYVQVRNYSENDVIVKEGDPGNGMYIVSAGAAAVSTQGSDGMTRVVLSMMGPGHCFGEMALLDEQPRSATVMAMGATTCLYIPASQFRSLLQRHVTVSQALLPVLVRRLREADHWIQTLLRSSYSPNI